MALCFEFKYIRSCLSFSLLNDIWFGVVLFEWLLSIVMMFYGVLCSLKWFMSILMFAYHAHGSLSLCQYVTLGYSVIT